MLLVVLFLQQRKAELLLAESAGVEGILEAVRWATGGPELEVWLADLGTFTPPTSEAIRVGEIHCA